MNYQNVTKDSLKAYEGMTPVEVINTFIEETDKTDVSVNNESGLNDEERCLISFFLMLCGFSGDLVFKKQLYKTLLEPHFQREFTLTVNRLILVFKHIEAYEMLDKMQKVINKMGRKRALRKLNFWGDMQLKPKRLKNKYYEF